MGSELGALLVASLGVFLGSSLQGVVGFGFAFVAVPVLGLVMPERLPQVVLLCAAPLVVSIAWRERRFVSIAGVSWTIAGRLGGVLPGLLILTWLSGPQLQAFVGVVVFAAALAMLRLQDTTVIAPGPVLSVGAGITSGAMATTVGMGGPPIALLYSQRPNAELRGSLSAIFLIGNIASTASLALAGHIDTLDVALAGVLVLPLSAGLAMSRMLIDKLEKDRLTTPVLVLVLTMGVVLILRSVL